MDKNNTAKRIDTSKEILRYGKYKRNRPSLDKEILEIMTEYGAEYEPITNNYGVIVIGETKKTG